MSTRKTILQLFSPGNTRSNAPLLLLLFAAILPSVLVLWFTAIAIKNEQLARRQIELELRVNRFKAVQAGIYDLWRQYLDDIGKAIINESPTLAFKDIVSHKTVSGLVILSSDSKNIIYPTIAAVNQPVKTGFFLVPSRGNTESIDIISRIQSPMDENSVRTVERLVPNLQTAVKDGDGASALQFFRALSAEPVMERLLDGTGRHLLSNLELYLLEQEQLLPESDKSAIQKNLINRLNDYEQDILPASQRRFIMARLQKLNPNRQQSSDLFPTLQAESTTSLYLNSKRPLSVELILTLTEQPNVWQAGLVNSRGIVLFSTTQLQQLFAMWLQEVSGLDAPQFSIILNQDSTNEPTPLISDVLHAQLPKWQLNLQASNSGLFNIGSLGAVYISISVGSVLLIFLILYVIARVLMNRMALAQQKNTMVATVSHELKTPVSSIKVLVDAILQDADFKPKRVKEYLGLIAKENLRLGQLIENFLSYSRMERAQFELKKEVINVAEFVDEVAEIFKQQTDLNNDNFNVLILQPVSTFRGDPWALTRVLLNLLDNAYKYSVSPRKIALTASVNTGNLVFVLEDNGIGIGDAEQDKIFNQFYQTDQKLSRSAEGCGLGLSIVRQIVALHGGEIKVESELGQGTTFTVVLPMENSV